MTLTRRRFLILLALAALLLPVFAGEAFAQDPRTPLPPAPRGIPPAPKGKTSFRFVVISDSNTSYGAIKQGPRVKPAIEVVKALRPELVIHAGDMIGGQKSGIPREQLLQMWQGYHEEVTLPLKAMRIPLVPAPGNHDASIKLDREVYVEEWGKKDLVPDIEFLDKSQYPLYYSFRHKGVMFVMMDAARASIDNNQQQWLQKNLAAGRRMPLRFVVSHIPLSKFITYDHGALSPKEKLQEIFLRGGVNALITGHHHVYYKGTLGDLNVLASGILGTGNRTLAGTEGLQPNSFIVLDIVKGKIAQCFAMEGPAFKTIFDEGKLSEQAGEYRRFDQK